MENHDYRSTWQIKLDPNNTVENIRYFKIFYVPKKYSSCDQYPQTIHFLEIHNPKNTPPVPVCKYAKSTP